MWPAIKSKIKWILGGIAFVCGGFLIAYYRGKKSQWENTLIEQAEAEREMDNELKKAEDRYQKSLKEIDNLHANNARDRLLAKARLITKLHRESKTN